MKIKKNHLILLLNVISKIKKISLSDARIRDVVIKQLIEHSQQLEKDRIVILEKFSEKDKDGNSKKRQEHGNEVYDIPEKNLEKISKEMTILFDEYVEIISDTAKLKVLVEKTEYIPEFGEVEIIDDIFDNHKKKK